MRHCGLTLFFVLLIPASAPAQSLQDVVRRLDDDRKALQDYTWVSKTEVEVAGEVIDVELLRISHDADGILHRVPLAVPSERPRRGKTYRKAQQRARELKALIDDYTQLAPQKIRRVISKATFTPGPGGAIDLTRIHARDVNRTGDVMEIWVDAETAKLRRFEIFTSLEGEPVKVRTEFEELPGGSVYLAKTIVDTELKEKKMLVRSESYDHERIPD